MASQKEKYHTGMSGEYFVTAQLQRMQITASITYGNAKGADVIAFSTDTGKAISIEVKTSTKGRWPVGNRVPPPADKLWAFVNLPIDINQPPDFFIMTQKDLHEILAPAEKAYLIKYKEEHGSDYGDKPGVAAITMKQALSHQNNWSAIIDKIKS